MRIVIHPTHPQSRNIDKVADIIRNGGVVIYPTDTVYGLGCDAHQKKPIERIYQMKQMKREHPVSVVCYDLRNIAKYAYVDDYAYRIMRRLVPGPYTFVLRATRDAPRAVLRKQKTVGIRVPDHPVALALVEALGSPLISTSASVDGQQHNDPDELALRFKQADAVVDSGWGGLEPSTVIDLTGDTAVVLRAGAGDVDVV